MLYTLPAMLILVGIIHLLPLTGALSAAHLAHLYGLRFDQPDLEILMRHRAVLFGLLGAFLIYAAFRTDLRALAIAAGAVSTISFIAIAYAVGNYGQPVARIVTADWIAIVALAIAAAARASDQAATQ